jgi:hypothetical protein
VRVATLTEVPAGTVQTTTLVELLNLLHIREYNRYFEQLVASPELAWELVGEIKPRILVSSTPLTTLHTFIRSKFGSRCRGSLKVNYLFLWIFSQVTAPSNEAVDHIVSKIIAGRFRDGQVPQTGSRLARRRPLV